MKKKGSPNAMRWILFIVIAYIFLNFINDFNYNREEETPKDNYSDKVFSIIASSDNEILDESIKKFAKKKGYKIEVTYVDTLDVISNLFSSMV